MSNARSNILAQSLNLIREGGAVSLDSAAHRAGLTKPGLMYHFRTKEALMNGLVDYVADEWLRAMADRLSAAPESATVRERVAAYLEACVTRSHDPADIVMLTDPRLRVELTKRWGERINEWFVGIDSMPLPDRGVMTAIRYMADGVWFATATGVNEPDSEERQVILSTAYALLGKVSK